MDGTVLVDTNVFTALLRADDSLAARYQKHLIGRRIAIAAQTLAEARYGGVVAGWGQPRMGAIERLVGRSIVLPVDDETAWGWARLRAECRRGGHALHQKHHLGDLWIAATAVRWGLTLVAHDAVFIDCPGLRLVTELGLSDE